MKLVKTSAIAVAISALLAGPVLAQGASDAPTRGAPGKSNMQGGAPGSGDEEMDAQPGGKKAAKSGTKSTVGAGGGPSKGSGGAAGEPAPTGKRY
jgi:hypothetical protein